MLYDYFITYVSIPYSKNESSNVSFTNTPDQFRTLAINPFNPNWQISRPWAKPIYGKFIQPKFMSCFSVLFRKMQNKFLNDDKFSIFDCFMNFS